jgi:hypothetical protein
MALQPAPTVVVSVLVVVAALVGADDPYRYFTWTVTYGPISPLGTAQQVCCKSQRQLFAMFGGTLFQLPILGAFSAAKCRSTVTFRPGSWHCACDQIL